jgi:predicted RNA-binding Zn-ribbon protein involved in translation (DUF1610 family)
MTQETRHPREHVGCPECDAGPETWETKRRLPQIGQTYECAECGHEVYVYDAGDPGETIKQWRPVTESMAMNLRVFELSGDWPDSVCEDLFAQGFERTEAIDYHATEREGLSQTEWAERTDRAQPTIARNVANAREKLDA